MNTETGLLSKALYSVTVYVCSRCVAGVS